LLRFFLLVWLLVVPVRGGPRVAPVEEEEGKSSAPAPAAEEADVAAAAPAEDSSSSAMFKPLGALGGQLTGLFDKVMPSKSAPAAGEDAKSSPPPAAAEDAAASADASSSPLSSVGAGLSNVGSSVGAGLSNVGNSVGAGLSSIGSFFGSALSPAGPQVEGQPNADAAATSDAAAVPAAAPAAVPAAAQPAQFGFYEGEGEVRPEGDSNNPLTARPAKAAAHHSTDGSTGSTTSRDGQTNSSGGKEIGSAADPRMRNPNGDLNNRGACAGGWSNWFGIFATCTGNRSNENIPKPVSEEDEKENTTKE